jgi:hypothetical protein
MDQANRQRKLPGSVATRQLTLPVRLIRANPLYPRHPRSYFDNRGLAFSFRLGNINSSSRPELRSALK